MQLGIIGMPKVGKTTIFELLTASQVKDTGAGKTNIGMARVPDSRIDYLSTIFKPKKTTYAQLEVIDVPGLVPGSEKAASNFLEAVRKADALLLVVRAFEDDAIQGVMDEINPLKEIDSIRFELLMADLDLVEKRMERINSNKKKNLMQDELEVLAKLKENLENEIPVSSINLDDNQMILLQNYLFLTAKPLFICVNLPEDRISNPEYHRRDELLAYANDLNIPLAELSAEIEKEINRMEGDDKQMFMDELDIAESGIVKIARSMYHLLGLISFFTVGEDEVKAWTIEDGTRARKAAGKIHSDIERGFIRAEVVAYDAFEEHGNMAALKERGLLRLEGKEYPVKDGDIVHYRFNV